MTESTFSKKLLKALRSHAALRDAVIWKLNDNFTKGIPDVLVAFEGETTYFELKCFPNHPTKIQAYYLKKLQPRAFVVTRLQNGEIFFSANVAGTVWTFNQAVEQIVSLCHA